MGDWVTIRRGHPLSVLANNWTRCAASRNIAVFINHTRSLTHKTKTKCWLFDRKSFLRVCTVNAAAAADPPCTECLPHVLKELKHARVEKCVTCDRTCREQHFDEIMKKIEEADAEVGTTLKREFLAAVSGSKLEAVNIFTWFLCRVTPMYPNEKKMKAFYEAFMKKYPSLAEVFYKNFKPFVFPAVVR